ncbi:MAG TPA: hypothetical protein VN864_03940 [Thermoplasmata archaeon]|nr:hypothetical protein [Thermoplasmata archaeon]
MSGRPAAPPGAQTLRVEVLKELQQLIDNREARDRLDKSPIGEAKGREHWVLHLLLRAQESTTAHFDTLIGTAYSNLVSRLQGLDDRLARLEEHDTAAEADLRARLDSLDTSLLARLDKGLADANVTLVQAVQKGLGESLDAKWKPVGESIETFAQGSRQILKDVSDTYRVATQTRLLLNENARRIADVGRDIVALEESLKLVVQKTIEDGLAPLEARVAALESHTGLGTPTATNGERPAPPSTEP